jgi:2-C-methyl-D-erythritol 4-phosphate cytidylyltransferase/2-C-methyl-D-erythritol 2,4-cyclodiphosphate synthase
MGTPFAVILVAAGRSERMRGTDKLWLDLWGRPVWRWSLDTFLAQPGLLHLALVVPSNGIDAFASALPAGASERCLMVAGGKERADSVIAGLWALSGAGHDDETLVLVHDAARPAVTPELVERVATAAAERATIPVVPVPDTLKRVRHERVAAEVERDEVAAAQTPQAAKLGQLRAGIEEAHAWGRPLTDDAGALAAAGISVQVIPGDPDNRKLTEPADLAVLRAVLATRATPALPPEGIPMPPGARAGIGFDAHRLADGRPMRLGGVAFRDERRGPVGHSDGDAALHALIDALLGAASLGDVGALFPSGDAAWTGADSADLLRRAVARLSDAGWRPVSADLTIVAARPAIAPWRDEIASRIGSLLGVPASVVGVKGSTSDGLGFGGEEGIAAWAVAVVERTG